MKAFLLLEDGSIFEGQGFGKLDKTIGEVVFNTGMTGYQEVVTDPSYYGQIVTMTYPLIGNYGVNEEDLESKTPKVRGFIVRELCDSPSNWRSQETIHEYLKKHGIFGIQGIDTRALTKKLRDKGTMRGMIGTFPLSRMEDELTKIRSYRIIDAVNHVTTKEMIHWGKRDQEDPEKGAFHARDFEALNGKTPSSAYKVVLMDFGLKENIVKSLLTRGCEVVQVPSSTTYQEVLDFKPHGVMLSNGPGDPKDCTSIIQNLQNLYGKVPIFGICLGHQLLALANGADTEKLKFGHRGCNHPVKDLKKGLTYITSQNHGYAIIKETLDDRRMELSHISMNDGTVEGVIYKDAPVFSVQFHPEASPGPHDTSYLFDDFISMMEKNNHGV
jgi:carbamoyl-phosphate synthase small subunit